MAPKKIHLSAAERFDAKPDSDAHCSLRDSAWMGGPIAEGCYLLGRLTETNLFRLNADEYLAAVRAYMTDTVSSQAADVLCEYDGGDVLIHFLRRRYVSETDDPPFAPASEHGPPRNERVERGIEFLLYNMDATASDLATFLQTTEKQVRRLTALRDALAIIDSYKQQR